MVNNAQTQLNRELFINLVLHKLCGCGDDECPLKDEGLRPNRRCKNWPFNTVCSVDGCSVSFFRNNQLIIRYEYHKMDYQNPKFEFELAEQLKNILNIT